METLSPTFDSWIGELHPLLVHFPIVLFTLTLVADIMAHYKLHNAFLLGCWLLWAGTAMAIPTVITGWEASESFPAENPYLQPHMLRAFTLLGFTISYSTFRWIVIKKNIHLQPFVFIFLSIVLLYLTSITAEYGGILSHGTSPFRSM